MQYNVAELELSWINAPSELPKRSDFCLVKTEDGNLGFVSYGNAGGHVRMYMWTRVCFVPPEPRNGLSASPSMSCCPLMPYQRDTVWLASSTEAESLCWRHSLSC